ncbi:9238_t:CDS:2, partial [Dentiscutata heterogama]
MAIASESKKEVIEDLIEAFSLANIPLKKINSLLLFFKKHLKEGGAIPQASTLCQLYLPHVFNNHFSLLQDFFNQKSVAIIMDETMDECSHHVNNSIVGEVLLTLLVKYNIAYTLPRLFVSDSAAYMKKCYREVLKLFMPQLVHAPCCAHIINLIG